VTKFQSFKVAEFQSFKVTKLQRFRSFLALRFVNSRRAFRYNLARASQGFSLQSLTHKHQRNDVIASEAKQSHDVCGH
jgi:hypothetical protein